MTRAADTYYSPIVAMAGGRLRAEATLANRDAILAVLERVLPAAGTVLEVGSGSGEHAVHFAANLPALIPRSTDKDP